ncbi:Pex19 protein [Conidiobolus coronatus NRRL 28638]|uniref:Pex19 protein n=1 Tax=Conidiobolus coronatus (strain ATCC 28846 / CBS 209.66 / NRRL 28638) TaxID=796925 RepID=A0A137PCJ4_CONC2|nr:Pex19 protein [Conidiobolus coronatus NRRL 28638]|eukprot:KXN72719.1 Pex19 protein [Conidiobolus coronatus NRRL 28638]
MTSATQIEDNQQKLKEPQQQPPVAQEEGLEDDLDDLLDDALDDFSKPMATSSSKQEQAQPAQATNDVPNEEIFNNEFNEQLAQGMQELLKNLNLEGEGNEQFNELLKGLDQVPTANGTAPSSSSTSNNFSDAINQTMNKLKNSSDQVKADIDQDMGDELSEIIKQMEQLSDMPDFEKAIESMMGTIMTKDLLYQPMKDLADKYPEWLEKNKSELTDVDYERYIKQNEVISKVIVEFDKQSGEEESNNNSEIQAKVMELMQEMHELGQPPATLLKEISPDIEIGADGEPTLPKNMNECPMM